MRIWNISFFGILFVFLAVGYSYAGIRIQGADDNINKGSTQIIIKQSPQQKKRAKLAKPIKPKYKPPEPVTDAELEKRVEQEIASRFNMAKPPVYGISDSLGKAQIFIDAKQFSPSVAKLIMILANIGELDMAIYAKDGELRDVFGMIFNGMDRMPGIHFKRDSKNRRAKELGIDEYMVIYYMSPFGERRIYNLIDIKLFLEKLVDVKDRLQSNL